MIFCLCVSGSMKPSADSTKMEITHCNTFFLPISNKCLRSGHLFLWCEELSSLIWGNMMSEVTIQIQYDEKVMLA